VTKTPADTTDAHHNTSIPPEFVRAAFEWLPIGVMMVTIEGAIVLANRELERMFGYPSAELIGQAVEVLVPDGSRIAHPNLRKTFLTHPQAREMAAGRELFGRRKDGSEIPLEVGLTPVPFGDTPFVVVSVVDITERQRIQNEAHTAREDRLQFEALVGELGAEFVNLRPEEVDRAIEEALGRIVRALDLDRSALFQVVEDTGDFVHTHQWTRPGWATPPPRVSARERFPWHLVQIRQGQLISFTAVDEVPNEIDRENLTELGTKSGVTVPLVVAGHTWGAVSFGAAREPRAWTPDLINRLRVVALIFANVLTRKRGDEALGKALEQIASLRDHLRDENKYLLRELRSLTGAATVVGNSAPMRRILEQVRQVAGTDSPVLLLGDTGTGKALLAARIHDLSPRRDRPMVRVNCASLSAMTIETELFGAEQGAYAQAEFRRVGRLEIASGSTLFLDEVADLPLDTQASLARVLHEKTIRPIGHGKAVKVDLRVIAASSRNLLQSIEAGSFRDDLYYRLNVFPIHLPALAERIEDIPLLVWRFVDEFSEAYGKPIDTIDKESMAMLQQHRWPGNARELRNVVERAVILANSRRLVIELPKPRPLASRRTATLAVVEKEHIAGVLAACEWQVRGSDGAAARLGLTPRELEARMAKYRLRAPRA
jgi:PAS domain S-box-containing protein